MFRMFSLHTLCTAEREKGEFIVAAAFRSGQAIAFSRAHINWKCTMVDQGKIQSYVYLVAVLNNKKCARG